ncbi:fumarylacetoacetate hydrolase family protein [Nocardia sp. NPDC019395]|uniref:fumarylacetoacetate hydrolase family protein n=1 Tax=Nocardia sp. NPDC019395 TaxID=3154686 RepID=UPI0033C16FE8
MRLATFTAPDLAETRVGVVDGDTVYPFPEGLSMRDVIDAGLPDAHRLARDARTPEAGRVLGEVRLLAPLRPASIRDSVAFEEHVEGVRRSVDGRSGVPEAWYDAPTFYFTNPHAVLGPDDEALFPATCAVRDFELEVAVVVGRAGRSLTEEQAGQAIFGYTIMNDWSARDLQSREMQVSLGPAKGKDFATSLGPWIVTADELDPYRDADGFLDLACSVTVNGDEIGRDVLSNAGWTFESMIAYASRDSGVVPGDVIGSGTVGNGGCLGELWGRRGEQDPPPLQPGDIVTLTVEGIGVLSGRIGIADPAPPLRPVRRRDYAAFRRGPV